MTQGFLILSLVGCPTHKASRKMGYGVLPSRSELSLLRHEGYNKSDLLGDPCSGEGGGVFFLSGVVFVGGINFFWYL